MWATAIIVFREILEASLIVSLVVAVTQGLPRRSWYIYGGIFAGIIAAMAIAILAEPIADFADGMGQELFNASVLLMAVLMLTWHLVWMAKHSKHIVADINGMGQQLMQGSKSMFAISIIVGLAILREGAEIILLLYGMTAAGAGVMEQLTGGLIGLVAGVVLGLTIYLGLVNIPTRYFFKITSVLILLLAAGLSAQAAAFLSQADFLPSIATSVWDSSFILSEQSLLGQILHSLIGYSSQPSAIQIIFYVGTIFMITILTKLINQPVNRARVASVAVFVMFSVVMTGFFANREALASDKIYSPYVEFGEFELEYRGHFTSDSKASKDKNEKNKFEVVYGFSEYWSAGLLGTWQKTPGSSREFTATSWENIFQLTDQGEYWVDIGLYLEYVWAAKTAKADKVEAKLLLEYPGIGFSHTANIVLEQQIGSNADNITELEIYWRSKYRWKKSIEPAFEIYSKLGELGNAGDFDTQKHSLGPVILGELATGNNSIFKYELGYLIGISDAAPDASIKWVLEWETYF